MQILYEDDVEKTFVERTPLTPSGDDDNNAGVNDDSANINANDVNVNDGNDDNGVGTDNSGGVIPPPKRTPATHVSIATRPVIGKTRIGSGLVTDTIGEGGMASIYKVWNERLEVFRAVKMLSLDALYDRFETEIKLTAKLRHPHIVEIFNVGEWNGTPYMEMEYIDGENLQQILNRYGRLPEAVCTGAAICMASALDYAHNLTFTLGDKSYSGIIHRDLKPANIMFSKLGEIKITDFGIARPAQASLHTREGNIVGTLHYLSPEQMEGSEVDQRSDIYSLGTLIYEMVTGAKTFPLESMTELLKHRAANSFRKPSDCNVPVNPSLSKIIMRCLEHDPRDRYQSAASLLADLRKAHAATTSLSPELALACFYPKTAANTPYTKEIQGATEQKAPPAPKFKLSLPSKKTVVTAAIAILAILLTSYMIARIIGTDSQTARRNQPKITLTTDTPNGGNPANNTDGADNSVADVSITPDAGAPSNINTPSSANKTTDAAATTDINTSSDINTPPSINTANNADNDRDAPKAAAEQPAKVFTESECIRDATAAVNKKDWARAIKILERPGVYREKRGLRDLLLLESYVESKRLDRAQPLLDSAARTNDAHYFLSAGKYWYHRGNYAKAAESLEASLTRSSISKSRNVIFDDAMYYIAMVRSERFRASPTEANRLSALDGWRRVQSAYRSRPGDARLDRAEKEIAALN